MKKMAKPSEWTLDVLNVLEWKRFEELCTHMFEHKGFTCKTTNLGSDEGIDIHLFFGKENPILDRIVHCKTWEKKVGVELMREFFGTMQSQKAKRGSFVSRGGFTDEAIAFAAQNNIHTIDGKQLLEMIAKLELVEALVLLEQITEGDYVTPTCANCNIKLVPKSIFSDRPYWNCINWKPQGQGCMTKVYITLDQLAVIKPMQAA